MKGSYVLIIEMDREMEIEVGRLGPIIFKKGYYLYVGSAMNGLEARISRHLSKDKKMRWHVDYILGIGKIVDIYIKPHERVECLIAEKLSRIFDSIPKFGSSDCKCKSHLFYSRSLKRAKDTLSSLGLMRGMFLNR